MMNTSEFTSEMNTIYDEDRLDYLIKQSGLEKTTFDELKEQRKQRNLMVGQGRGRLVVYILNCLFSIELVEGKKVDDQARKKSPNRI